MLLRGLDQKHKDLLRCFSPLCVERVLFPMPNGFLMDRGLSLRLLGTD